MTEPRPYLNFAEALAYSRIPRREFRRLLATGEIHSRRFGRRTVIAKEAIDRYLQEEPLPPESMERRRTG